MSRPEGMNAARLVARERYVWPGGYALFLVTADGGVLCSDCVRAEYRNIYDSHKTQTNDGWQPTGIAASAEIDIETVYCDHCGRDLSTV